MKQLEFFFGSLELLVLCLGISDFFCKSFSFSIGSGDICLSLGIFGVAESFELGLLFLMLFFGKSSLLSKDTIFLCLSISLFFAFLSFDLIGNSLQTIGLSLCRLLPETLFFSFSSFDSSDASFFGNPSIFFLLPGSETSFLTFGCKFHLLIHGISQTTLDSCVCTAFLTGSTEGLLLG
jgi:hypothetical protein